MNSFSSRVSSLLAILSKDSIGKQVEVGNFKCPIAYVLPMTAYFCREKSSSFI